MDMIVQNSKKLRFLCVDQVYPSGLAEGYEVDGFLCYHKPGEEHSIYHKHSYLVIIRRSYKVYYYP